MSMTNTQQIHPNTVLEFQCASLTKQGAISCNIFDEVLAHKQALPQFLEMDFIFLPLRFLKSNHYIMLYCINIMGFNHSYA